MKEFEESYSQSINKSKQALNRGDRIEARRWAQIAAHLSPSQEEPWLILAAISNPEASIEYRKHAQKINSKTQNSPSGTTWAQNRLENDPAPLIDQPSKIIVDPKISKQSFIQIKPSRVWNSVFLVFLLLVAVFIGWNSIFITNHFYSPQKSIPISDNQFKKETRTPTPSATPTETPLPTSTPIPTQTTAPTNTQEPTPTLTKITRGEKKNKPKKQVKTTKKVKPVKAPAVVHRPSQVGESERWIDIDLSSQRAYAYIGDQMAKGFIVSTGTWQHPTVTGVFHIYVKYRFADMSGPGYHLPDVPYVMYFYKDYGLHGTYWHHNFGTPMSHGCVNFSTPDSAWLFDFASIGTVVNIHR